MGEGGEGMLRLARILGCAPSGVSVPLTTSFPHVLSLAVLQEALAVATEADPGAMSTHTSSSCSHPLSNPTGFSFPDLVLIQFHFLHSF